VLDRDVVLCGQPLGNQEAVARLGVALDAEQRDRRAALQRRHQQGEVDAVEDFDGVASGVLGGEFAARTLADPLAVVLGVLELAQRGGGSEGGVVVGATPAAPNRDASTP
jgi:hypothetical protein